MWSRGASAAAAWWMRLRRGCDSGAILASGRIANGTKLFPVAGPVVLYQADIRELQLAKGAIASGFKLLLKRLGADARDLRKDSPGWRIRQLCAD